MKLSANASTTITEWRPRTRARYTRGSATARASSPGLYESRGEAATSSGSGSTTLTPEPEHRVAPGTHELEEPEHARRALDAVARERVDDRLDGAVREEVAGAIAV